MKSITEIQNFEGKKVLVRVDWDVPFEDGVVVDGERVEASIPTIEYIKAHGGTPIVVGHFGRKGESIQPVIDFAKNNFPVFQNGVEFLENLRIDKREEENNESFAKELASKADIYVNDSFATSHREHASIVGVPKLLPSYAGLQLTKEVEALSKAFNPEHPFLFILGGAKLETKLPLLKKFLDVADKVFVGGILAAEAYENTEIKDNPKVMFPLGDIKALDVNQETLELLKLQVESSKFILWNGPLGNYENDYTFGTEGLAQILADAADKNGTQIIVGGGDTLAAIKKLCLVSHFTHLSLAGGAMLDFLVDGRLVGIDALG